MYSNRLWIAASLWLRVRMWLPRSSSRWSQEREDPLQGEILKRQARDLAAPLRGEEHEQQPDRVAVAAHRTRPQSLDRDQVVEEVGMQQLPERLCAHRAISVQIGSANASKRRLASSSSAGVIVR